VISGSESFLRATRWYMRIGTRTDFVGSARKHQRRRARLVRLGQQERGSGFGVAAWSKHSCREENDQQCPGAAHGTEPARVLTRISHAAEADVSGA
jgi:hypothetical protein